MKLLFCLLLLGKSIIPDELPPYKLIDTVVVGCFTKKIKDEDIILFMWNDYDLENKQVNIYPDIEILDIFWDEALNEEL